MRILICVDFDEAAGGTWDYVCLPRYQLTREKLDKTWNHFSLDTLSEAIRQAITFQKTALSAVSTQLLQRPRRGHSWASVRSAQESLLGSSWLVENSNVHKSLYLDDVVQLLWSINEIRNFMAGKESPHEVIVSSQQMRSQLIELDPSFAEEFDMRSSSRAPGSAAGQAWISRFRQELFHSATLVKGILWLAASFVKASFRKRTKLKSQEFSSVFLDYFFDVPKVDAGEGYSKFWRQMPRALEDLGLTSCYAHIFVPDAKIRTLAKAKAHASKVGSPAIFLDDFIRPGSHVTHLVALLSNYKAFRKRIGQGSLQAGEGGTWLRRNQDRDLAISLFGTVAATHLVYDAMFERFSSWAKSSSVKQVVYVCEFQGWESLLTARLRRSRIRTIGYCHSSVRRLDLRGYAADLVEFSGPEVSRPDVLAAHSIQDLEMLEMRKGSAAPVLVESTRYSFQSTKGVVHDEASKRRALIVGGYSDAETQFLLDCCQGLTWASANGIEFSYLRHPKSRVETNQFRSVSRESFGSLPQLLEHYSIVICAAETSAAMEALLLGKLVTIVTEPGKLVASPVFGYSGVEIARNSEDLGRSLHSTRESFASELAKLEPCQSYRQQFRRWAEVLIESS